MGKMKTRKHASDSYKSREFDTNIINHIRQSMEDMEYCDIRLVSGNDNSCINCHRLILASVSEYFQTLLKRNTSRKITLNNTSGQQIKIIASYAYNGLIDPTLSTLELTLETATRYYINGMIEACKTFLTKKLDVHHCVSVYCLSKTYNLNNIRDKAFELMLKNFESISKEKQFLQLSPNDLQLIFANDSLCAPSGEIVFDAFQRWLTNYKGNCAINIVHKLMPFIQTAQLNAEYRRKNVDPTLAKYGYVLPRVDVDNTNDNTNDDTIDNPIDCPGIPSEPVLCVIGVLNRKNQFATESLELHIDRNMPKINLPSFGSTAIDRNARNLIMAGGIIGKKPIRFSDQVISINLDTLEKSKMPSLNVLRAYHGMEIIAEYLYVFGGSNNEDYVNSMERLNLSSKRGNWQFAKEMPQKRAEFASAVLDGFLYAVGGRYYSHTLDIVERYCPKNNSWTTLAPLLLARNSCGLASFKNYLYVISGCTDSVCNRVSNETVSVERYDPRKNEWNKIATLQHAADQVGVAVWNNYIYAVGGYGLNGRKNKYVQRYNAQIDQWELMPSLKTVGGYCILVDLRL